MADVIYEMTFGENELLFPESTWTNRPGSGVLRGPLQHPLGMFQHLWMGTGFPADLETPQFVLDVTNGSTPSDAELDGGGGWMFSHRAKTLLEALDPEAFAFLRAETRIRSKEGEREGPDCYLCDVIRFVDAVDESQSEIDVSVQVPNRAVRLLSSDNKFRGSAIGGHKIFRLMYTPRTIACTEDVRAAWREAGLTTNIVFRRLGEIDG